MTLELALLIAGAVLVVAAALSGRPGMPGTRAWSASPAPRLALAFAGVLSLTAGLILLTSDTAETGQVRATITAELASDEVSEEIRVFIDGRDKGVISVDERRPTSRLAVTVDWAGRHRYRLESTRQVKGKQPERAGREDDVVIAAGGRLDIVYSRDGEVYLSAE